MSKKVGIITQHRVVNYGSVLQTYALQEKIKELGYVCEVIDYYPERFTPLGMLKRIKNKGDKFKKSFLIRTAARVIIIPSYAIRFHMFFKFLNNRIDMTSKTYKTEKELEEENFCYDIYCTGSDQVWNTDCAGFDPAYFLSFVPDGIKKNAYAASFGFSDLPSSYTDEYKRRLDGFHCISVREASGAKIIKSLLGYDVPVVLDPTLLLDSEDWQSITPALPKRKKGYILVYNVLKPVQMLDYARRLAREKGLEILYINGETYQNFDLKHVRALSPEGFLALYKNADYVLTNSFHGTVFSIIFKRPFLSEIEVYKNGTIGKNGRAQDLPQALGLQQRTLAQGCKIDDVIDWRTADQKKGVLRDAPLRCLQEIWREENG